MSLQKRALTVALFVLVFNILNFFTEGDLVFAKKVEKVVLDNGLTLVTLEEHKAPVVTFQIWYRVGSRNERTGKTGLAHLTEHMMFKGTNKYKSGEFAKIVSRNGGSENAFTSKDYTAYFENFASDRLELSMELEADRMHNLIITDEEFQTERDVVKEERRLRTEDDPQSYLVENVHAISFLNNSYHSPIVGWMSDLNILTRDDISRFYKNYYVPDNATIVIVGDFDTKVVVNMVKKHFGSIPKSENLPEPPEIEEPRQIGERRVKINKEAHLPFLILAYKAPNYEDEDSIALGVLSNIMSHGKSSRLFKRMVYEEKIVLDAFAEYNDMTTDPYLFYYYGVMQKNRKPEEFEAALEEEIEKLKKEPVSDRELKKAKNQIEAAFVFAQDSNFYQAMNIGIAETIGAGFEYLDEYLEKVRKVTKDDIMRVAAKYFIDNNKNVGILYPIAADEDKSSGGHAGGHPGGLPHAKEPI